MGGDYQIVIPARYDSSRLPGKPLADLGGKPMVVRVAMQASATGARGVVVATDDRRVADAVHQAGFQAVMTRADHASGSDRIMEVAASLGWPDETIVVNVQGDEPLIPPEVIVQVANGLESRPEIGVFTLCEALTRRRDVFDPNQVKVTFDADGRALYFSRAPIPYARDAFAGNPPATDVLPEGGRWFRHIGIYGYRVGVLRRFVALPASSLEQTEMLEQLRLLENGIPVQVAEAVAAVPPGIDTPEDLAAIAGRFADS